LKKIITTITDLEKQITDNLDFLKEINLDLELICIINENYDKLNNEIENLKIISYLNGPYDQNDCILEIHSGAGGTEACDWVLMLYRMYERYLKKNNYQIEELYTQNGEETGYKYVSILVKGNYAYGYLKGEKGIHRLVRISPFDSNKRRHTSFASVEIIPQIKEAEDIKIDEKDIKIDIYRSSGPGGQGVNTTDSAVRITHLKTGIVVTCQNERSQIKNKERCMQVLMGKLKLLKLEEQNQKINQMKTNNDINFGYQKRSYVMCPYTLVKDNESKFEKTDVLKVLDGQIDEFIKANLRSGK